MSCSAPSQFHFPCILRCSRLIFGMKVWYSPMVGEVLNGLSVAAGTALLQPVDLLGWFMLQGSCEWHLCMKFLVCMEAENR